jgi:hypothetical protein
MISAMPAISSTPMSIPRPVMRIFALLIVAAMVCLFASAPFVLADSEARQERATVTDQPVDVP